MLWLVGPGLVRYIGLGLTLTPIIRISPVTVITALMATTDQYHTHVKSCINRSSLVYVQNFNSQ